MAKIIEQIIAIKLSKIVKDSHDDESVLTSAQKDTLVESIPELAESIVDDTSVIVEVIDIES